MKKIIYSCIIICTVLLTNSAHAQEATTFSLADGVKIFNKAVTKTLLNSKGELAPGDNPKEVYGYKRNTFDMYINVDVQSPTLSTSSLTKVHSVTNYKTNQTTKTRIESSATTIAPVVAGKEGDAILFRVIDKYVRGNLTETYLSTDVDQEKVYNIWKINPITDLFKAILLRQGVPTTLSNTIIKNIISKKYLKLTAADLKAGILQSLGVKAATINTGSIDKETDSLDKDIAGMLSVKQYLGTVNYDDVEILTSTQNKVTTTKLHNLVLSIDYTKFAQYAIKNKKVHTYTFDAVQDGTATEADVIAAFKNIYENMEVLVWIDTVTSEVKGFEIEPYGITYTSPSGIKIDIEISMSLIEGLTTPTGYIDPIPSRFITLKEIRNMFLKY
ncbi:MAG: hypothetical protein V4576_03355 [Patescibacteria group bacterium]